MTDVCNCEYTSHGHCGKIVDGDVDNDATLEWLAATAVSHARAGADIVAPSDMMDGRVAAIRTGARRRTDFRTRPILSYAAKFASVFYGPFREAAESTPQFGDRRSYQMDPANGREAMREIELDLEEGADMIMVKPAMPYLDLIWQARQRFDVPIGAYQVSGEFSMIMAAARNGWIDHERAMMEIADLHPARRRRFHPDLFRQARGAAVSVVERRLPRRAKFKFPCHQEVRGELHGNRQARAARDHRNDRRGEIRPSGRIALGGRNSGHALLRRDAPRSGQSQVAGSRPLHPVERPRRAGALRGHGRVRLLARRTS